METVEKRLGPPHSQPRVNGSFEAIVTACIAGHQIQVGSLPMTRVAYASFKKRIEYAVLPVRSFREDQLQSAEPTITQRSCGSIIP
jgi:hypothetical protein